MVTPNPARVRFVGFAAYSLDVEIFAYLRCVGQDAFLAIQEDLFLRMADIVGDSNGAALAVFSEFLADHILTPPQIRFTEMVIDQLTPRGVMEASALYEPSFSNLHVGGPDGMFAGKENVVDGMFAALDSTRPQVLSDTA